MADEVLAGDGAEDGAEAVVTGARDRVMGSATARVSPSSTGARRTGRNSMRSITSRGTNIRLTAPISSTGGNRKSPKSRLT